MIGDQGAATPDPDPAQICGDLDAPADRDRMHRVVVAVEAHVMIARQPCRGSPPDAGPDRRQCQHRCGIGLDAICRSTSQHSVLAVIGPHQPGLQLGIEIRRRGKDPTRQERPLQVVVETFDQPLGFGITGFTDPHFGGQGAAEGMACRSQFRLARPPPPDRALAVPHQHPWNGAQRRKMLPPPGIQVFGGACRDQQRRGPPRIPTHHGQHR